MKLLSRRVLAAVLPSFALLAGPLQAGVDRWTSIGPDGGDVTALAFSANGRTAWAGTRVNGVFRSVDGGKSWATVGLRGAVRDLAAGAAARSLVYAATSEGVFRSDDAGSHWTALNAGLPAVDGRRNATLVATEPTAPAAVWVGLHGLLYRSVDLGATWRPAAKGLEGAAVDVAPHPRKAGVVYAATTTGVFRSPDSGRTWSRSGLRGKFVQRIVFDRGRPDHLYAVVKDFTHRGFSFMVIFVSDDRGGSWKPGGEVPNGFFGSMDLVADPAQAGVAWAGVSGAVEFALFKTTDGGLHWQGVQQGNGISVLAANPLRSGVVLAGQADVYTAGEGPAILRSEDGGASWSPSGAGFRAQKVLEVVPDPSRPGALYARGRCCSLWKREGGDRPWIPLPTGISLTGYAQLVLDPTTPSTLYLATALDIHKSVDAGASWQGLSLLSVSSLAVDPVRPSVLYGAPDIAPVLARSDDDGLSWGGLDGSAGLYAELVTATATAVYADGFPDHGTYRDRLRRSTDGGATWTTLLRLGRGDALFEALFEVLDPRGSDRLWAAGRGAVFVSEDGGATWSPYGKGLPPADVLDLRLDPFDPDTLYAATDGGSVYALTRSDG
jgi:photosystem II stability/assembly factor-like uncharacterized protein